MVRSGGSKPALVAIVVVMLLATSLSIGAERGRAAPAPEPTPAPRVTGPVSGGLHGHPWYDPPFEVASIGYEVHEYFVAGNARGLNPNARAPYQTRILVVRPAEGTDFSGTVLVEWDNVTIQAAFSPMFTWLHPWLFRNRHAFVSVSAQAAGVCCSPLSHVLWDPLRYGSLNHPGDDYSFDIYSQVVRALRSPAGTAPLGALDTSDLSVIATGNSQSASRLKTYVDEVHDRVGLVDAFVLDAGGARRFAQPPSVPTVHFFSEDGIEATEPRAGGEALVGSDTYRLWEVPGASHNDADTARHIDFGGLLRNTVDLPKYPYSHDEAIHAASHYGEEGPSTFLGCQPVGEGGNEYPRRYAVVAAHQSVVDWLAGSPPPQHPRVRFDGQGRMVRDELGHPRGGVRLPPLDVPVARYLATTCLLFGQTIPLSPLALAERYPTHADYVREMQAATDEALAAGFMLAPEADELMGLARASKIPHWDLAALLEPVGHLAGTLQGALPTLH